MEDTVNQLQPAFGLQFDRLQSSIEKIDGPKHNIIIEKTNKLIQNDSVIKERLEMLVSVVCRIDLTQLSSMIDYPTLEKRVLAITVLRITMHTPRKFLLWRKK
jgi:hypothetical protein